MTETHLPLISYLLCNLSRLAYFNNDVFFPRLIQCINIPAFKKQLHPIKNLTLNDIFKQTLSRRIEITNKINHINYSTNPIPTLQPTLLENVKYVCISTSNYSSVYIVAIKDINSIFISCRGTYSPKSASSWSKIRSSVPFQTCDDHDQGYMLGIFKIIAEIFYTILESISFLSTQFLHTTDYKLFATGHSLGGAASLIFSFLFLKYNPHNQITCVTFGTPRVLNGPAILIFNTFIKQQRLMFKRYVTNGDFIPTLPPLYTHLPSSYTYYHPDEYDNTLHDTSHFCRYIHKNTKHLKCYLNKTTKTSPNVNKYHGNYLGISFTNASQGKADFSKEIKRNQYYETIGRIIVGGNNLPFSISFFNLEHLKRPTLPNSRKIKLKLNKIIAVDYKHADIFINKHNFINIIDAGYTTYDIHELNPLLFHTLPHIIHTTKLPQIYCL